MARKKQSSSEGKNKFLLLLMISLTVFSFAVAGYMWFERQKIKETLLDQSSGKTADRPVEITVPIYYPLETFTLSLKPSAQGSTK